MIYPLQERYSLKYYRDLNNIVDTAKQEGEQRGLDEASRGRDTNCSVSAEQSVNRYGWLGYRADDC